MHDMVAVTGEKAQGEQFFIVVEWRGDISPPAQAVCNHVGINRVALVQIHVALLKLAVSRGLSRNNSLGHACRSGSLRRLSNR